MNLPVTPMAGVRTVRELVLFRIKGKKRKQKYPPFIDTPEFPQLFDLPTNIQSCRSITSGPAHLTSKEKCQKYWHHQHKTHAASNDQDVGLSVICQNTGKVIGWMTSSLKGTLGYISPQGCLLVTNNVITSYGILSDMSPSQNKLKVLNQV